MKRIGIKAQVGYQYVHNGGTASDTVVNSDGWQIVKEGGLADFTTVTRHTRTGGIALPVSRHHLADTAVPVAGPALRPYAE